MTYTEILGLIQRNTNTQNTTTSSYALADKTVDINNALNNYFIIANSASGNWRPADDTNQGDYPVIYADIVLGQQDYALSTDQTGNQVLDIYKVRILNQDGVTWNTLTQINQDDITDDELSTVTSGTPSKYYLTANGIFLVQKPSYNMTDGLEVWISRTPTYFTVSDTTKKAGLPWVHHEYLALRPSYQYCLSKGLPQTGALRADLENMEMAIKRYWSSRNKDFNHVITSEAVNPF